MLYLTTCVGFGYGPPGNIARGFSRQQRITDFTKSARHHVSPLSAPRICLWCGLHAYPGTTTGRAQLPSCVTPSLTYYPPGSRPPRHRPRRDGPARCGERSGGRHGRSFAGTGISTRCPSTTPVGLALGPDSPRADELDPGTLDHSAPMFLTSDSLLMPAFSLAPPPPLG